MIEYQKIRDIDINSLHRTDLGAALNFSEIIPSIKKISEGLLFFEGREGNLTNVEKEPMTNVSAEFLVVVNLIQQFQVEQNESHEQTKSRRVAIIKKATALHRALNQSVLPLITHLKFDDTKIQETITNTQNKISQIDKQFTTQIQNFDNNANARIAEFDTKIQDVKRVLAETEQIKIDARNFSVEKLVEKYGDVFSQQASRNSLFAFISLAIFVISVVGLIFLTYKLFTPLLAEISEGDFSNGFIIVNSIFRLTLILIASVFVKESIKSFNANMHLYNLNSHRQNALLSFDTLVKNAKDSKESRDKIIEAVAQTIYANQENGYLSSSKKMMSAAEVIELIKAFRG